MSKKTSKDGYSELQKMTPKKGTIPNVSYHPIQDVLVNEKNPRWIPDDAFERLKASISSFPQMLEIRPIVVDENNIILGGNMRYRAAKAIGMETIPVAKVSDLNEEQKKQFIVKDNVSAGFWDYEVLANNWDDNALSDWGVDIDYAKSHDEGYFSSDDEQDAAENYTRKIDPPIYEPSNERPDIENLTDTTKYESLLKEIESSDLAEKEKLYLRMAATRHIVFNYDFAADFYAHADTNLQHLMEESALVILDFDQAIEKGFVKLTKRLLEEREVEDELE